MQPTGGGGVGGGGGGGGGLQRFRSAPATWLEALLDEDVGNDVLLDSTPTLSSSSSKPPQPQLQPQPVTTGADLGFLDAGGGGSSGGGLTGFLRQNSSPAEFLAHLSSDDYFSNIGIQANYDYLLPSSSLPPSQSGNKRTREADSEMLAPKLSSPLKREQSTELHGGIGGLFDAGLEKPSEDSVLCRARAKRGFATHPRSIAERVRRTRISDRIRKLQELVPNMDKQTNTADMLEEAVEYVKFLQRQIEELTELQKKCKCSLKE